MADVRFRVWASIVATVDDEVKVGDVAVDIPLSRSFNSLEETMSVVEAILLMGKANRVGSLISYIRDEAEGNLRKLGCHRDLKWTRHETTIQEEVR